VTLVVLLFSGIETFIVVSFRLVAWCRYQIMMSMSRLVIVLPHLNLILADDILIIPSVTVYGKQWQGDLPKGVFGRTRAPAPR